VTYLPALPARRGYPWPKTRATRRREDRVHPEGEFLGYITLEQARVLPFRHAQDNAGFYGPSYARVTLFWEVTGQEEGEEFYSIRLSFRSSTVKVPREMPRLYRGFLFVGR